MVSRQSADMKTAALLDGDCQSYGQEAAGHSGVPVHLASMSRSTRGAAISASPRMSTWINGMLTPGKVNASGTVDANPVAPGPGSAVARVGTGKVSGPKRRRCADFHQPLSQRTMPIETPAKRWPTKKASPVQSAGQPFRHVAGWPAPWWRRCKESKPADTQAHRRAAPVLRAAFSSPVTS